MKRQMSSTIIRDQALPASGRGQSIRPIDDLYEQYGWNERIFSWTKERTTFGDEVYGVAMS